MYIFFMTSLNTSIINNLNVVSITIFLKVKPELKITFFNCTMQSQILAVRFIRSFDNILEPILERIHLIYKSVLEVLIIFKDMLLISVNQLFCLFIFQEVILVDWTSWFISFFNCFRTLWFRIIFITYKVWIKSFWMSSLWSFLLLIWLSSNLCRIKYSNFILFFIHIYVFIQHWRRIICLLCLDFSCLL